jgi:hypothetical protein
VFLELIAGDGYRTGQMLIGKRMRTLALTLGRVERIVLVLEVLMAFCFLWFMFISLFTVQR